MGLVTKVGDIYTFTVPIKNSSQFVDTNVAVTDVMPAGMAFMSYTSTVGSFNHVTGVWTIGSMAPGQEATLYIKMRVTDISLAPFVNTVTISGDLVDPNLVDNTSTETVNVTTCPPAAGAINDPNSCACGDVSANDTLCTYGQTEFRVSSSTFINLDPSFTIDISTGKYNASGKIIDPYATASFNYSIWCIDGTDEYETSGPAVVTIPAQFPIAFVDSLVDNSDGTYTHTSLNGTAVTFNAGWTTVTSDAGAKTITLTYPDATTHVINISTWFPDNTVGLFSESPGGFLQYETFVNGVSTGTVVTSIPVVNIIEAVQTYDTNVINIDTVISAGGLKNFHLVNDSTNDVDISLPDPASLGLPAGITKMWTFKRANITPRNGIIFAVTNNKFIDGSLTYIMADDSQSSITFWTNGVNYFIM